MKSKNILLSIRPRYAELIFSGQKTVELRRVLPNVNVGDLVVVYISSPIKQVGGTFEISSVISEPLDDLWQKVELCAGISYFEFQEYFSGVDHGFGLAIKNPKKIHTPISLSELQLQWNGFFPPQSFRYLTSSELNYFL